MSVLSVTIGKYRVWQWLVLITILLAASFIDIKSKSVPVWLLSIGVALAFAFNIMLASHSYKEMIISLMPGIIMLFISRLTGEAIGYGDDFLICIIGLTLGIALGITALMMAFILSFFVSVILLCIKKARVKETIPFVPFLLLGTIGAGFI